MAGAGGCGAGAPAQPAKLPSFPSTIDDAARGFVAALDRDGDGRLRISAGADGETIHASGVDLTAFVRVADTDGDGASTYEELAAVLRKYDGAASSCPQMGAGCPHMKASPDGTIDEAEGALFARELAREAGANPQQQAQPATSGRSTAPASGGPNGAPATPADAGMPPAPGSGNGEHAGHDMTGGGPPVPGDGQALPAAASELAVTANGGGGPAAPTGNFVTIGGVDASFMGLGNPSSAVAAAGGGPTPGTTALAIGGDDLPFMTPEQGTTPLAPDERMRFGLDVPTTAAAGAAGAVADTPTAVAAA